MSNDWRPFINWIDGSETKQQRLRIINDLVRFVLRGVEGQYGPAHFPAAETFESGVKAALFDSFTTDAPPKFSVNSGDTIQLLADELDRAMTYSMVERICAPPLPDSVLGPLKARVQFAEGAFLDDYAPSVEGAYQCAKDNFLTCETRIVCLTLVNELTRRSEYSEHRLPGYDQIREELYRRRGEFMLNILLFGGLLGGEAAKEALKLVAVETIHNPEASINFAVMHYLASGGRSPGHWLTAAEDEFRADIVKKFEALG